MLNKILLVCVLFTAGSSLTCKWMDKDFQIYSKASLALLKTMKKHSKNSTDEFELDDAAAFPNELYKHASEESRVERLRFVAHVLGEIDALFEQDQTHASWSASSAEDFLNIISQQADAVRSCVGKHKHHLKNQRKMSLYFKRLSRHVLEHMGHSADAWELVREEIQLHLHRVHILATS
ncbi:interferon a3-like [Eucyclogobius newberryi]|uniref:interferon a3-like n=1 Tax=Eucyclogobius newberryi TaxID=166745 RepID=UPI003B5C3D4A